MSQKTQPTTRGKFYACSIQHLTTNFVLHRSMLMSRSYILLNFPNEQCWRYLRTENLELSSHKIHPSHAASCLDVLTIIG